MVLDSSLTVNLWSCSDWAKFGQQCHSFSQRRSREAIKIKDAFPEKQLHPSQNDQFLIQQSTAHTSIGVWRYSFDRFESAWEQIVKYTIESVWRIWGISGQEEEGQKQVSNIRGCTMRYYHLYCSCSNTLIHTSSRNLYGGALVDMSVCGLAWCYCLGWQEHKSYSEAFG